MARLVSYSTHDLAVTLHVMRVRFLTDQRQPLVVMLARIAVYSPLYPQKAKILLKNPEHSWHIIEL
jgi:hypothetical protein